MIVFTAEEDYFEYTTNPTKKVSYVFNLEDCDILYTERGWLKLPEESPNMSAVPNWLLLLYFQESLNFY